VTPKGTKPGDLPTAGTPRARSGRPGDDGDGPHAANVAASSRYTPPVHKWEKESPRWWPFLMLGLFAIGGILILLKYLSWVPGGQDGSSWWIVAGLGFVLAGLFSATKWK